MNYLADRRKNTLDKSEIILRLLMLGMEVVVTFGVGGGEQFALDYQTYAI